MRRIATIVFVSALALIAASCSFDNDSSAVAGSSAVAIVNSDLLGDGGYIGSGSYTVIDAQKAYSASEDATAVAAKVSVPGIDDLCLFWYVGGRNVGDGLTIGDTTTRQFSVWGATTSSGSPADDMVKALKSSPEGKAVIAASGC